jgi:uncharacterized protein with NAD-binding domain and iron-sulfur cluster
LGDEDRQVEVAIIGGGCAAITTAFELTRPEHRGKYNVTVYQQGWRLGGKGASGRGPADRIEEHGLHIWLGFYENAFRLMRECYRELGRDPATCPIADWRDAFYPDPNVGMADIGRDGQWLHWTANFPPAEGLPGDPLSQSNPFTMTGYLTRTAALLRTLLTSVHTGGPGAADTGDGVEEPPESSVSVKRIRSSIERLVSLGMLGTVTGLLEAVAILEIVFRALPSYPENSVLRLLKGIGKTVRAKLEDVAQRDDESRYIWEIIDLVLAILVGIVRFRLVTDRRGFDAINDYECREWLLENGASQCSVDSAFVRGLFDLAMAYPGGDVSRPALAAGQAIRGSLRMFFSYRGALFWKMRAGMGDVVFAPFYEVLKKRGVRFQFFHRLENVRLADQESLSAGERDHVAALEFDVQALIKPDAGSNGSDGVEYQPLVDIRGLPCWPSTPDYSQLIDGERLRDEGRDFECFWDTRKVTNRTLEVGKDFDFVVLGVGIGAVPHVCSEIVGRDARWRDMVEHVRSVPSQAFQIWMNADMQELGWDKPPTTLSAFVKPFDTWADMGHLIDQESWQAKPHSIAYFCNVLADEDAGRSDTDYPRRRSAEVRDNAVRFLNENIRHLWPNAARDGGGFRWDLLLDPAAPGAVSADDDESAFSSQFWTANVNPTDRYTLALPGTLKYRISPLDNTYDNLTICGDWTDCGFNEGCVEAAVMSGRLAAHALCKQPALEDIIGYDHP